MATMKWRLMWTLHADGEFIQKSERGLGGLQECKARLFHVCREAEEGGFAMFDAHAMPEFACGTVRLMGMAPMGVARCGAL